MKKKKIYILILKDKDKKEITRLYISCASLVKAKVIAKIYKLSNKYKNLHKIVIKSIIIKYKELK